MSHPDKIIIDGVNYSIPTQESWTSVRAQLETLARTGHVLLGIPQSGGVQHVWVSSGTSLVLWESQ
jgi:hypothetical protein